MLKPHQAIENVLDEEGGYRYSPSDPGRETNFGISKRSYPLLDIKNLSRVDAYSVYDRDFFHIDYAKLKDELLAYKIFSFAVNMGSNKSHSLLQAAINIRLQAEAKLDGASPQIKVDGVFGTRTRGAANLLYGSKLYHTYLSLAFAHYKKCATKQPKELNGWLNRIFFVPKMFETNLEVRIA